MLAEAFHRPPAGHRRYRLSDSFLLDGEVRFDGFVAEVGALVWEGETVSWLQPLIASLRVPVWPVC